VEQEYPGPGHVPRTQNPGLEFRRTDYRFEQPKNRPVHAALWQQEMRVRMNFDPVPEGLESNNNAGDELFSNQGLKIYRDGLDG
jgi:hypothetical protein